MKAKILLASEGGSAAVVAVNGKLRLHERKRAICHGYANGCVCAECKPPPKPEVSHCECERPMAADDGCFHCGKPIAPLRAA